MDAMIVMTLKLVSLVLKDIRTITKTSFVSMTAKKLDSTEILLPMNV